MEAPDVNDARSWDRHFRITESNGLVLIPHGDLRGPVAHNLIPGFQLIDKNFVLRFDAAGHRPRHNFWTELLPAISGIVHQ
jgi:hypothetical protein